MKISLAELLESSPIPPYADKKRAKVEKPKYASLGKDPKKETIIKSAIFKKAINDKSFWLHSKGNGFLDDYLKDNENSNSKSSNNKGLNHETREYEWPTETVLALWAILVSYRYYAYHEFKPIKVGTAKPKNIEALLTAVERETIDYHHRNALKQIIVDLPDDARTQFNDVKRHVLDLVEALYFSVHHKMLSWDEIFDRANFPVTFRTMENRVKNPVYSIGGPELKLDDAKQIIINSFYPQADDGASTSRAVNILLPTLLPTQNQLKDSISKLERINVDYLPIKSQLELKKIIKRVHEL